MSSTPPRPAPPGGFNAVFIIGVNGDTGYDLDWKSYIGEAAPADLFDGSDNYGPAPFLLVPAADAQIAAAGWKRASDWSFTDDIWGCVVIPAEGA